MNNGKLRIAGCLAGLAGALLTGSALAQPVDAAPAAPAPAPPPEPAPPPPPPAEVSASGQVGLGLPGNAPEATAVAGTSDHDSVVGRLAIGYLGRNGLTVATGPTSNGSTTATIDTPVIGIRYWLSDMIGIDAGLGFGIASSSQEIGGTSTDNPSLKVFMLHGGLPLSLASAGHFSFQIIPELNVGLASASSTVADVDTTWSGFHFDIGARAGSEIHFGFIGVPQLSLQGSVGVRLNVDSQSYEQGMVDNSASQFSFGTTVGDNPWNIFTSNVAALYYF